MAVSFGGAGRRREKICRLHMKTGVKRAERAHLRAVHKLALYTREDIMSLLNISVGVKASCIFYERSPMCQIWIARLRRVSVSRQWRRVREQLCVLVSVNNAVRFRLKFISKSRLRVSASSPRIASGSRRANSRISR